MKREEERERRGKDEEGRKLFLHLFNQDTVYCPTYISYVVIKLKEVLHPCNVLNLLWFVLRCLL